MKRSTINKMLSQPQVCARSSEGCNGRLTIEHPFGRTGPLADHCIWLCEKHHGLGPYWSKQFFDKLFNKHVAYQRIPDTDIKKLKMSHTYLQEKRFLERKYGLIHIGH